VTEPYVERDNDLRYFLGVLQRRKWVIVGVCLLTAGAAGLFSKLHATVYQGSTEVLIDRQVSDQVFSTDQSFDPQRNVQTEVKVAQSGAVAQAAKKALGHEPEITIDSDPQSDVITIHARNNEPRRAAADADAYAKAYVTYRRERTVNDLLAAGQEVQSQIDDIDAQLAALPLESAQRTPLDDQRSFLVEQLDRLQVSANLSNAGGAAILAKSDVPGTPVAPKPLRDALLGAVLGLILGIGLAFLIDYLDDSIKARGDMERAVANGVPVLGEIPTVTEWKKKSGPYLISQADPSAPASEAYRTLRTSVEFLGLDTEIRRFQVTSARSEEGKTTTLANLAVALARAGRKVAVVSADLRRPRIHEFFGLPNDVGLTSVLLGEYALHDVILRVPDEPRLALLPSGPPPPNPSELLASSRVREILLSLGQVADMVLFDSPPVLPVSDALVIAGMVDATLVVASAGESSRRALHRAYQLLRQVDARVVGMVLNNAEIESENSYGYGYYHHSEPDAKNGNGKGTDRRAKAPETGLL
jgi:polysaccharide biosynthesis transport protein